MYTIFELFSVHLLCLCLEFEKQTWFPNYIRVWNVFKLLVCDICIVIKNIIAQVVTRVKVSIRKFVSQVISIPHQLSKDSKQLKNSNFGVTIFVYFITIYPWLFNCRRSDAKFLSSGPGWCWSLLQEGNYLCCWGLKCCSIIYFIFVLWYCKELHQICHELLFYCSQWSPNHLH